MWISAGIQVYGEFHYKKQEQRALILFFLLQTLKETYPGVLVTYDGESKHHRDGNDICFTVPVHGLMSSINAAQPEDLAQKIHALKQTLLAAQRAELGTDS